MSLLIDRRQFLIATVANGVARAAARTQTFRVGVVPAGVGGRAQGGRPVGSRTESFLTSCSEVASLGLRYIEVNTIAPAIAVEYAGRSAEFKAELERRHLMLAAGAAWAHMHDAAQRQDLIEQHLTLARFIAACGGTYITQLLAAGAGSGESDEAAYRHVDVKTFAANIRKVGQRVFGETGIRLGYHPEQGEIVIGLHDRILEAVDEEYFGVLADVGHLAAAGTDPVAFCRRFRSRLIGVHLKDFKPATDGVPAKAGNAPFGQGVVNFPAIIGLLRETQFSGYVIGESGGTNEGMRDFMVSTLGLQG